MKATRTVDDVLDAVPTMEGAGVRLRRVFGFLEAPRFDPFLLLDDFRNDTPSAYLAGFPWHPHRGIETITYMLVGRAEHGDSLGNSGTIGPGDVQWMTAGSGIVHQEMPKGDPEGRMGGFQLWANLPRSHKMMAPRYRDVLAAEIPAVGLEGGASAKVIAGELGAERGPVRDVVIEPTFLDVAVPRASTLRLPTSKGETVLVYVVDGRASFGAEPGRSVSARQLAAFGDGDEIAVETADEPVRFLLFAGRPLGEPVAWRGPIVMNTDDELRAAFEEYRAGTFIKSRDEA